MSRRGDARRREVLWQAFEREKGLCFWCDEPVSWESRWLVNEDSKAAKLHRAATFDHIIPRSKGGSDTLENALCACYGCNARRKDMAAHDFMLMLAREKQLKERKQVRELRRLGRLSEHKPLPAVRTGKAGDHCSQ